MAEYVGGPTWGLVALGCEVSEVVEEVVVDGGVCCRRGGWGSLGVMEGGLLKRRPSLASSPFEILATDEIPIEFMYFSASRIAESERFSSGSHVLSLLLYPFHLIKYCTPPP